MKPRGVFYIVTADGTNMILLIPELEPVIDARPLDSASIVRIDAMSHRGVEVEEDADSASGRAPKRRI